MNRRCRAFRKKCMTCLLQRRNPSRFLKPPLKGSDMALNKIRLGDYIECSTTNNTNLVYGTELICGVTNDGIFTAPRGNVDDVNLKPYKIVENGAFVYNPSRLDLGSIAYRTEGLCIVSHLYIVFILTSVEKRSSTLHIFSCISEEMNSCARLLFAILAAKGLNSILRK